MRRLITIGLLAALAAGCSGGGGGASGGSSTGGSDKPCPLVAKLDDIANGVAQIDVADPATSKQAIDVAVGNYSDTLRRLQAVVPAELQAGIGTVIADVEQYRFDDARTDRAALDAWAARECGRTVTTPSTAGSASTSTSVASG